MSADGERRAHNGSPQGLAKRFFKKFVQRRASSPASGGAAMVSFTSSPSNGRRRSWSQRLRSRRVSSNSPGDDDDDYSVAQEPAKTPSRVYSKSVFHSPCESGHSSGVEEEVRRGAGLERRTRSVDDVHDTGGGVRRGRVRKGRWKLGNRIAKGSFGTVFMGLNEVTGELIAVKVRLQTIRTSLWRMRALQNKHTRAIYTQR
jgi:hypothetical protein